MSRWSLEDDGDRYDDDLCPNATCECGADFSRALDDNDNLCDSCSDAVDAFEVEDVA